jgi:colanic acid biosynthesis glycosyl transferase WcaI
MSASSVSALFITRYYRPELIGSGPFCADVAEWLVEHDTPCMVMTGMPHYPEREIFPSYRAQNRRCEILNGVSVLRLSSGAPRGSSAMARILNEINFFCRGLAALATGAVSRRDLTLSLCPSILSVALGAIAKRRGGRHLAIVHDIQSGLAAGLGMVGGGGFSRIMQWCERLALNRTDQVIVLSLEMQAQLRAIGVTVPIEIVPIWVDTDDIRPISSEQRRRPRVLYSGNLGRKQGLAQILAFAGELLARRVEVEIVLRGEGNQAEALKSEVSTRGLTNVRFATLLPRSRLSEGLAAADIHLVPQDPQGAAFAVPSKVYSIMAAGRPFVSTALPDSPLWRLQAESGAFVCVPPNDACAMADAVLALIDDETLRLELGARGRSFVEQHFSKQSVLHNLGTLLRPAAGI